MIIATSKITNPGFILNPYAGIRKHVTCSCGVAALNIFKGGDITGALYEIVESADKTPGVNTLIVFH